MYIWWVLWKFFHPSSFIWQLYGFESLILLFLEEHPVDFEPGEQELPLLPCRQKVVNVVSHGIEETVGNCEVGEDLQLSLFYPDLGVAEYQEVLVVGNGPFPLHQGVHLLVGQGHQHPRLVSHFVLVHGALGIPSEVDPALCFYYQHNVRDIINVLVVGGWVEQVRGKNLNRPWDYLLS